MSSRKRRLKARKHHEDPADQDWPATEAFFAGQRRRGRTNPPPPNKWLLAAAVGLQSVWVVFLVVVALAG